MDGLRVQNTYVRILSIGCLAWSAWVGGRNCESFPRRYSTAATQQALHHCRYTTPLPLHHRHFTTAATPLLLQYCLYSADYSREKIRPLENVMLHWKKKENAVGSAGHATT